MAIFQTTFAGTIHCGVFCTKTVIAKGVKFGPFKGRIVNMSEVKTNDDNSHMWEVCITTTMHFIQAQSLSLPVSLPPSLSLYFSLSLSVFLRFSSDRHTQIIKSISNITTTNNKNFQPSHYQPKQTNKQTNENKQTIK